MDHMSKHNHFLLGQDEGGEYTMSMAYLLSWAGRLGLVWWSFPIAELVSLTISAIFLRRTLRAAGERLSQN